MFRLIAPSQYRRMPWKNGGGSTDEIATHPGGATLETFDWRISIAEIMQDGPFSRFDRIDRTITLLEGAGMRLSGAGDDVVMAMPFEPYPFAGEAAVHCSLMSGAIRDFNVMTRRDRAQASVTVVRATTSLAATDFLVVFAAMGAHACRIEGASAITVAPGHSLIVERSPSEADSPVAIRPLDAGAVALAVRIRCR